MDERAQAMNQQATSHADLSIADQVAEICISNGPMNLVTRQLLVDLSGALVEVAKHREVRCLIVHGGSAKAFCAGSDIKELADLRGNASERKILYEDMVVRQLARIAMPTIAALDGHALGGGLELALACDLRVCRQGVKLGLTESRIGGLAANGALRVTRLLGTAKAKELLFTGDILTAEEALALGIVNQLAKEGSALDAARRLAAKIAERGPVSNRLAKELVDLAFDLPLDAALVRSTVAQQEIFDSHDLHEGVAAFLSKRDPKFTGV
jgi:enoyl-CoA hydratase/carnithine racemase